MIRDWNSFENDLEEMLDGQKIVYNVSGSISIEDLDEKTILQSYSQPKLLKRKPTRKRKKRGGTDATEDGQ